MGSIILLSIILAVFVIFLLVLYIIWKVVLLDSEYRNKVLDRRSQEFIELDRCIEEIKQRLRTYELSNFKK